MSEPDPQREPSGEPGRTSLLQVVGAVFWSFFGVRKRSAMSRDVVNIKPQHVIIVGIVLAAIFVLALVALVQFITRGS
jgi:amino acid transporter